VKTKTYPRVVVRKEMNARHYPDFKWKVIVRYSPDQPWTDMCVFHSRSFDSARIMAASRLKPRPKEQALSRVSGAPHTVAID
jgi:hypothetical protein